MARIDAFLQMGREQGCSDIHFTVGLPPLARLDGDLVQLKYRNLTLEETSSLVNEILNDDVAFMSILFIGAILVFLSILIHLAGRRWEREGRYADSEAQ